MKKGLFFKFRLLFVFVLFLQDSFAQDSPQWHLPEGVKARLGRGRIVEMRYSPDGTRLVVASSIGIWFYDTATFQEVDLLTGHTSWVTSIAFSLDGQMLASGVGREDNTIRLWDATTGEHKRTLTGNGWTVHSVAFSPDGETLASGSGDGTVLLWELPPSTVFGDVNRDGVVNLQDLVAISSHFGRGGQNDADLNGAGVVNILDLVITLHMPPM